MRCTLGLDESAELVVGYAARTLDPLAHATFERHLKSCEACGEAVAAQQAVWQALDQWRRVDVAADFDRRLYSRIEGDQLGWWPRTWRAAVPVAAGVVLGVVFWLHQPRAAQVAAPAPSQASRQQISPQPASPQIDKLEHALDDMDMLGQLSAGVTPGKAGSASPI
jgi:hypothetical protein